MPLSDLFGLLSKRQTSPDKYLQSSVNVVSGGQAGAMRQPFSNQRGIQAFHSWVYAASTINANAVASLPLRLYAKKDATPLPTRSLSRRRKAYLYGDLPGDARPSVGVMRKAAAYGDEMEEVVGDHPILDLLSTSNPYLNGFDLTVLRVLYGELTGNAYLHPIIDEASGNPVELWPLAPQYVEVIPDEEDFLAGYLYGIDASKKQVFETDEVIHFRRPNPGNLYYGLGKVEAAYGVIQSNDAVKAMDLATFANQARPDYAVVVKGSPTSEQLDRFQYQVQEKLRGTRKEGNFLTVTGDVQFTPLNFPPKDLAGREEIVEEIAAVFGVPVTMLKANDPNLASAQTGFAQWREGTILPLCRMDEEELNQSLLPLFGLEDTHCLAYDNPVPADRAYELQERQTAVAGGWRTPNEARAEEGKEPIENEFADQLLVGGSPLGGGAAAGGGLLSEESPEPETIPDIGTASALLQSLRSRSISTYTATKMLQVAGFSRSVAERMVEAEEASRPVEKVQRMDGEPVLDCIERGMEVLTAEGYDRDQAYAIARVQCGGEKMIVRRSDDLYATREEAEAVALAIGCEGAHEHEVDGRTLYMPCDRMEDYSEISGREHPEEGDPSLRERKAIEDVDLQPTEQMAELAERGLRLRQEHGRGGTEVGVARARDIKNRENLSPETVARMANFFSRHRVDLDAPAAKPDHEEYPSAGVIAWLLWGGDPANPDEAGAAWSERKIDELERAEEKAEGDRVSSTPAKPSERIEGSDENPEGSASGTRGGIEISEATEKALKNKVEEHNEKHGDKKGKKVDLGMLKAVYRRGAGAFSTSHRPGMTRQQWSLARVNAFLYLVRNGRPEDAKYVGDNDLLPKDHPKYAPKDEKEDKACGCVGTKSIELDSLGYEVGDLMRTKSATGPEVYEWPESTKWMRLEVEGLDDDFARLRPKAVDGEEEPTADEDIRTDEKKTPAMQIATATEGALKAVRERLEKALQQEEIRSVTGKARGRKEAVRRILKSLEGVKGVLLEELVAALTTASAGGGSAGIARVNEILRASGRQVVTPQLSDALAKAIQTQASTLVAGIVDESVERFASGLGQTFSVDKEIERLQSSYGFDRQRAEVVARTESARAYHEGQIDAWKESGTVTEKHFLKAANACQFCDAVEAQFGEGRKSIGIGDPMLRSGSTIKGSKGGTLKIGRTSQGTVHPNCRCDIVPVLEDFG